MDPTRALKQALDEQKKRPDDFGCCVRTLRALADADKLDLAVSVARGFAKRAEADDDAGDTLLALVISAPQRHVDADAPLVREGTVGHEIYVILSGAAGVQRFGAGRLAILPPGTVVGEVAPLSGTARTATVRARWPLEVAVFDREALDTLRERLPTVFDRLQATGRARMLNQLMGEGSVFSVLNEEQRGAVYDRCVPCTLPEGTRVVREGHPVTAICIIAAGQADVWRRDGGSRKILNTMGPGDVFGEIALLLGGVASATVEAISPLTVYALDAEGVDSLLAEHPDAREKLTELATERMREHPHASETEMPVVRVVRG